MEPVLQIINQWSGVVISVCGAIGALIAIVKPIREWVVKKLGIGNSTAEIKKDISEMRKEVNESIKETRKEIAEIKNELNDKIQKVSDANDQNEKDRIRREITNMEAEARAGKKFTMREFEGMRADYEKYHNVLHGNGIVTEAYNYVVNYYNTHAKEWGGY